VDCATPGIVRRRRGRGFEYIDIRGKRVEDLTVLQRIKDLAIPPAWQDVWICPHPNGHLQAVGIDRAGRKQYLYHEAWRRRRDQEKFDHMTQFARALPMLRSITTEHLAQDDMSRDRVLACSVRLLDRGFFRIGGESYAQENETYGLATMRKEHVKLVKPRTVIFEYVAKSKKERYLSLVDPSVYEVVQALKRRRAGGDELLAYRENRRWRDVRSSDINAYVKEISNEDFSAKDFRTWHATVLAAVALAVSTEVVATKTGRKRAISRAMQEAAHYLGNTPAVSRSSYVDPRVVDRYEAGVTISGILEDLGEVEAFGDPSLQGAVEEAVLDLIEGEDSAAIEKVS
jgi:DNA topoisomerase IB